MLGLSLVAASRGYSSLRCGLLIKVASLAAEGPGTWASAVAARGLYGFSLSALGHWLSRCGAQVYLLHSM